MHAAKQAIQVDVGGQSDIPVIERASSERVTVRKVLPIVEGVVLVVALIAPLVLQDYLTGSRRA